MSEQTPKGYYTDGWTEPDWRVYKARQLAAELLSMERHGSREWWNLLDSDGMAVKAEIALMQDGAVVRRVVDAGYVWDGKEWRHGESD